MVVLEDEFVLGCGPGTDLPLNTYISMYARTNRCYNKRGSRTNYVCSSITPLYLKIWNDQIKKLMEAKKT